MYLKIVAFCEFLQCNCDFRLCHRGQTAAAATRKQQEVRAKGGISSTSITVKVQRERQSSKDLGHELVLPLTSVIGRGAF